MTTNDQPQTIPADKVRDLRDQYARLIEDAGTKETQAYYGHVVKDLDALLPTPKRPTLADMTDEERAGCRRMQADVEGRSERYVIAAPYDGDADVALIGPDWEFDWIEPECVTPRPDLPRLEWPGAEKPAPAPTLPGDWRLADHKDHGRVLVVRVDGENAIYAAPFKATGLRTHVCMTSDLTYLDQEADQ